jgi:formamidase
MKTIVKLDLDKKPWEQDGQIHNRWHPDLPMIAMVKPGDEFRVECMDWTGGQIGNNDSANDIRDVDLTQVHYLSGPIGVEGAEPGDLMVVDILDVGTFEDKQWGFNGIFAKENGGGFLVDHYPDAKKSIWDFHGIYTSSRHVPNVKFAGIMHPGLIGCLPSRELLDKWNKREADLIATDPDRVPALALPPEPKSAVMGKLTGDAAKKAAMEGARTVPPRDHGGNCDIKNLTKGSKIYFPVYVKDGGLSMGDLHFSQGDGEITFCGAIEMAGYLDIKVTLIKDGVKKYGIKNPIFQPSVLTPTYRQACLNAIEYLKKFGYSGEQAVSILGTAPVEGHISGIVDIPNACATLWLPTEIFDFDLKPNADGPKIMVKPGVDVAKTS